MNAKKLMIAAVALGATTALAADYTYAWKAGEKPASILNGKVTITYNGDDIKSMNLTPDANSKIIFTGDKMTFTAADNGAYLTNLCSLTSAIVFQNPVEFKGHFRPYQTSNRSWSLLEQKYEGKENFLSDKYDTVIIKGKKLADWVPITTLQNKTDSTGATIGNWSNPGNTMKVAVVSRSEGKLTFQFQAEMNEEDKTIGQMAHLLKVVKLELFQDGADVKGRVVEAASVYSRTNAQINVGIDVDNLAFNNDYTMSYMGKAYRLVKEPIRTKETTSGYGINTIEFKTVSQPTVFRFENAVSIGSSSFCASIYTRIEIADASKLSPAFGTWPSQYGTVALQDGSLVTTGTSYAGGGSGSLVFESTKAGSSNTITISKPCKLGVESEYVVRGTDEARMILKVDHFQAYPSNGTVRISNGGQLDMGGKYGDVGAGINGGTCYAMSGKPTFVVEKGGLLRQCAGYTLGNKEKVILDGGKLQVGVTAGDTDVGTYLFGGIVFKNGAEVFPTKPTQAVRVGNYGTELSFAVAGSSPSTNNVAMMLMGQKEKSANIAFNVKKIGDYAADFVQNADFTVYVDASEPDKSNPIYYTDAHVRKVGAGTMLLNGLYKSAGKLTLQEGIFELAKENAWTGKATIEFNGGTLKLDKAQNLPKIDVTAKNGTLSLASGAKAVFGDCSKSAWAGTLNIDKSDFKRGDVRFAAVPAGASLKVNGKAAIVDGEGCVMPDEITGSGTKEDPYLIGSYNTLEKLRSNVYNGNGYTNKYFKLINSIDLTGKTWSSAIGPWESRRFCGHFDGGNYSIIGLKLSGQNTQGFFGQILGEPNAKFNKLEDAIKDGELNEDALAEKNFTAGIKNIVFENCEIEAYTNASATTVNNCGVAAAVVRNAYVVNIQVKACKVHGCSGVGGVVGLAVGSVLRDLSTDKDTKLDIYGPYSGGVVGTVGENSSAKPTAIINCSNGATLYGDIVTANYYTAIGGVLGFLNVAPLLLKDCTNVGKIKDFAIVGSATGVTAVGGVIGVNRAQSLLIDCSNGEGAEIRLGEAAKVDAVGGMVGFGFNTVVQGGFVAGSIVANAKLAVAGLIGQPHSTTGYDNLVTFDGCGLYLTECENTYSEGVTRPYGAGYSSNCQMLFKNMTYPDAGAMSMAIPPAYLATGGSAQKVTIENPTLKDGGHGVFTMPQGPVTLSLGGGREFYLDGIALPAKGTLTVQMADGAKAAFGDCSAQAWEGTMNIAKTGYADGDVKFAGLTPAQLAKVTINGKAAFVDEDGNLRTSVKGGTYETAFTSIAAYNKAMANETLFNGYYLGKDVYLVIRDFKFQKGVDYSPEKTNVNRPSNGTDEPKLHAFFYNCTFPGGDEYKKGGVMGDSHDPTVTNRKQINLLGVKEAWVEGCTFEAFNGDSYVIDFNLSTKCDTEGCGITITNNTFKTGAGNRVPLSVKNKADKDPAFVKIVDNYFAKSAVIDGEEIQANAAGVLCFADQSRKGANFPITVENNRFEEGTETYVIMTGYYVGSGKEKIYVPVEKPFKWYNHPRHGWTAKPAFHARGTMLNIK